MNSKNRKTVIVLGLACSGTSVVAGMLHNMGINMNPTDNAVTGYPYGSFEDPELQELTKLMTSEGLRAKKGIKEKELDRMAKSLIRKRTNENGIWGFKSALTYKCIDWFMGHVKNPYFVVIFRNLLDNADSLRRMFAKNYGENLSHMAALKMVLDEQKTLISVIERYAKYPMFFVSFEQIKNKFMQICINLSEFLEVELNYLALAGLSTLYVDEAARHGQIVQ